MNYIVLDLEFNQPFDFKNGNKTILNTDCPFEIIQIGAVKLDAGFIYKDSFDFLIKPQIYSRIHPFVEKITGINIEMVQDRPPFPEAYRSFLDFIGPEEAILCTWGIDDIKSLFRNILYYHLDVSLLVHQYVNVQKYASSYLNYDQGKAIGLKNAALLLSIETENDFHNALYDADYTAKIFSIVCPEEITPTTFQIEDLQKKKEPKKLLNTPALLAHFRAMLGRELTEEEVSMLKAAYKLGRNKTFDITADKKRRKKGGTKK